MKQIESLFLGIIAALGALVIELFVFAVFGTASLDKNIIAENVSSLNYLLVVTVFIEEIFKYLIIIKRIEYFSIGRALILNSLLVGLGFSGVETALIYLGSAGGTIPYQSLIEIISIHIFTAGIIGYFIATRNPKKISTFAIAVVLAAFFHLSYNILALYRNDWISISIPIFLGMLLAISIFNLIVVNRKLAS
jgi:hypothetical protein